MTYNKPEVRYAGAALEVVENTKNTKIGGPFYDSQPPHTLGNTNPPPAYQADE